MPASTDDSMIAERLSAWARAFEPTLDAMLTATAEVPETLSQAVRYGILDGGKRVRPFIATRICELCGGSAEQAAPAAVAIECVHAFSLVHDDLPAMDDDDLRRGRSTCHKAFGEAVAVLAGDALLALAFEIPATRIHDPAIATAVVAELARGTGWAGMIGGQTTDILSEQKEPELALVERIHRYKTARLIECAARIGALSAKASDEMITAAATFGQQLGLAFQIADDLLDVTGTTEQMGKAVAKDAEAGKQTYPAVVGIDESRKAADRTATHAVKELDIFGPEADDLRELTDFVVNRQN